MADIMMCEAANCPLSKQCCRHEDSGTVPGGWRQSYWMRDDKSPVGDAWALLYLSYPIMDHTIRLGKSCGVRL